MYPNIRFRDFKSIYHLGILRKVQVPLQRYSVQKAMYKYFMYLYNQFLNTLSNHKTTKNR